MLSAAEKEARLNPFPFKYRFLIALFHLLVILTTIVYHAFTTIPSIFISPLFFAATSIFLYIQAGFLLIQSLISILFILLVLIPLPPATYAVLYAAKAVFIFFTFFIGLVYPGSIIIFFLDIAYRDSRFPPGLSFPLFFVIMFFLFLIQIVPFFISIYIRRMILIRSGKIKVGR